MVVDYVNENVVPAARHGSQTISAMDCRAVRHLLSGGSVVDWRALAFEDRAEIARFLAVVGYDLGAPLEMTRFWALHDRAMAYVEETFHQRIAPEIKAARDPMALFLAASRPASRTQRSACVVLKVMHVINHLEARRLGSLLPISERTLFDATAHRFDEVIRTMRQQGLGIRSYERSEKTEQSLVTKLLSKPRVTAAQIFDKLRFRVVTEDRAALIEVLVWFTRHLFPFSQVIPSESHNTILSEDELAQGLSRTGDADAAALGELPVAQPTRRNPVTAASFRMVGYVIDLPVRVTDLLKGKAGYELAGCWPPGAGVHDLGHLIPVTLEIQLFDYQTYRDNLRGEASHEAYKGRQQRVVARRLMGSDRGTFA